VLNCCTMRILIKDQAGSHGAIVRVDFDEVRFLASKVLQGMISAGGSEVVLNVDVLWISVRRDV